MTADRERFSWPFSREQWFSLPLPLRQKWWSETDYSRRPADAVLMFEVRKALNL